MTTNESIGVVGASARAAVMSLARAGHSAWAVDLFCDRDLKRIAPCARCPLEEFPQAIPRLVEQFPPGPVMYTGGLENHPDLIAELAARRPILGNGPDVLRRVRDPFQVSRIVDMPAMLPAGAAVPDGQWLVKSLRSSGGLGIHRAKAGETCPEGSYVQACIDGTPMSAVFAGDRPLGITEQLAGTPWLHARPFHYAGTIGPIEVHAETHRDLESKGIELTKAFGLDRLSEPRPLGSGTQLTASRCRSRTAAARKNESFLPVSVFGVDFILHKDGISVLEVNPRYPASVEILELAGVTTSPVVAKAIYFAPHAIRFPASGPWDHDLDVPFDPWRLPEFADIPEPRERIEAGSPVLTFFAAGSTADECRERLQSRARELDDLFRNAT